jgi:hypothetical protein
MNIEFNKRLLIVWLALTLLTLCYLWIDHTADHGGHFHASAAVTSIAIVIALIKVRVIIREFMEVRHAPVALCRITDGWVLIMLAAMLTSYFTGIAMR